MRLFLHAVFLGCVFATARAQDCTISGFDVGGPAPVIQRWGGEYEQFGTTMFHVKRADHFRSKITNHGGEIYTQFLAIKDDRLVAVIREYDGNDILRKILALQKQYGSPVQESPKWIRWWGYSDDRGHVTWFDSACGLRIDAFDATHPEDQHGIVVWTKAAP